MNIYRSEPRTPGRSSAGRTRAGLHPNAMIHIRFAGELNVFHYCHSSEEVGGSGRRAGGRPPRPPQSPLDSLARSTGQTPCTPPPSDVLLATVCVVLSWASSDASAFRAVPRAPEQQPSAPVPQRPCPQRYSAGSPLSRISWPARRRHRLAVR